MSIPVPPGALKVGADLFMQDGRGHLVPLSLVKATDLAEHAMVHKVIDFARELSAQIARFKGHTFEDIASHMDALSAKYGWEPKPGAKGNMSFTSYEGRLKVEVAVSDIMTFGPELEVAKGLIYDCIAAWSADARVEIKALVDQAFRTDRAGEVSRAAIFALRRVEIDDPTWRRAMDALSDAIRIQGSKTYLRFYERTCAADRFSLIPIDLASAELTPQAAAAPSSRRELAEAEAELERLRKLEAYCKAFVDEHEIICPEDVHQTDRVIENAYGFIEGVCNRVGYAAID